MARILKIWFFVSLGILLSLTFMLHGHDADLGILGCFILCLIVLVLIFCIYGLLILRRRRQNKANRKH
jgi:hypothetical protein